MKRLGYLLMLAGTLVIVLGMAQLAWVGFTSTDPHLNPVGSGMLLLASWFLRITLLCLFRNGDHLLIHAQPLLLRLGQFEFRGQQDGLDIDYLIDAYPPGLVPCKGDIVDFRHGGEVLLLHLLDFVSRSGCGPGRALQ